ncbi:hypothetical protein D3C76_1543240 [compost metagenome]
MEEQILKAYQTDRSSRPGAEGKAPELTEQDREAAKLAASYPEHLLRQAVVMRAAFERAQAKAVKV